MIRKAFIVLWLPVLLFSSSDFVKELKKSLDKELGEEKQRVEEFRRDAKHQQDKLNALKIKIDELALLNKKLQTKFKDNEAIIKEKEELLVQSSGDLGTLINIIHQSSSKVYKSIQNSYTRLQYLNSLENFKKIAHVKNIDLNTIENFWLSFTDEIIQSGSIAEFKANIINDKGKKEEKKVIRIGQFSAFSDEGFLRLSEDLNSFVALSNQPSSFKSGDIEKFHTSKDNVLLALVDITKGSLFQMQENKPTFMDRLGQGGVVGYIILILGLIGLVYGFVRIFILQIQYIKIKKQLKNLSTPTDNPLGKILEVFCKEKDSPLKILETKVNEEIIVQTNKIESGKDLIKLLATTTPLLGLLGTVTGMITTFQSITMFGTGDPKLMAGGISSALITTVLGLISAIPLLFIYSFLNSLVQKVLSILEEQSIGIMAKSFHHE